MTEPSASSSSEPSDGYDPSDSITPVEQTGDTDCQNAATAMLTPLSLAETKERWGTPIWEHASQAAVLREFWDEVIIFNGDAWGLFRLFRYDAVDAAMVVFRSPVSEYDEDQFWRVAAECGTTALNHTAAVEGVRSLQSRTGHADRIHDPRPGETYFEDLTALANSGYDLQYAYVCRGWSP